MEKHSYFSIKYDVYCSFFVDAFYNAEEVLFYSLVFRVLNHKSVLAFVKCFLKWEFISLLFIHSLFMAINFFSDHCFEYVCFFFLFVWFLYVVFSLYFITHIFSNLCNLTPRLFSKCFHFQMYRLSI